MVMTFSGMVSGAVAVMRIIVMMRIVVMMRIIIMVRSVVTVCICAVPVGSVAVAANRTDAVHIAASVRVAPCLPHDRIL